MPQGTKGRRIRNWSVIGIGFTALLAGAAFATARAVATRVYVNGAPLREQAILHNGVIYVPLRAVAEALNCTVSYDPKSGIFVWSNPQVPGVPEATLPGGVPLPQPTVPQPAAGVSTQPRVEAPAAPGRTQRDVPPPSRGVPPRSAGPSSPSTS